MPEPIKLFRSDDLPIQTLPSRDRSSQTLPLGTTFPFKRPTLKRTLKFALLYGMITLGFPLAIIIGFVWGVSDGAVRGVTKALMATYENIWICWKALEK